MIVTFLDIEASGLQESSYPIEIAWSDNLGNTDTFIIHPDSHWTHWDPKAELIHGITREKLYAEGISVDRACQRLNKSLGSETIYTDAADFDSRWLNTLYEAADIELTFVIRDIFEFYKLIPPSQINVINQVVSANPPPHRALPDCQRYAQAYTLSESALQICRTFQIAGIQQVLFVCTGNFQRSKTCDDLLKDLLPDLQIQSAGVSERECLRQGNTFCTEEMLALADIIFTFEQMHTERINHYTSGRFSRKIIELGIPDHYKYMQLELVELITNKLIQVCDASTNLVRG